MQPVILSIGAALAALDSDVLDTQTFELRNYLPFVNEIDFKKLPKMTKEEEE